MTVGASFGHIILFCLLLCILGILYKYKVKENLSYVNCGLTAAGWTKETSLGRKKRTFSQVRKTCLYPFSKSYLEKHSDQTSYKCIHCSCISWRKCPTIELYQPHNYNSQGKQWKPSDSGLSKLDWTKHFQIFSRKQSCSSQALMSVVSIICFSIQLQLRAAKFFSSHYGTK